MTNQSSFKREFLYLPLAFAPITSGCGDGSSANEPNPNVIVVPIQNSNNSNTANTETTTNNTVENTNAQIYEDAFVQLSYPED